MGATASLLSPFPVRVSLGKGENFFVMPRHLVFGQVSNCSPRFTILSRSQYARGLPDRAINTLKADHSPRLARWIVIQRERL